MEKLLHDLALPAPPPSFVPTDFFRGFSPAHLHGIDASPYRSSFSWSHMKSYLRNQALEAYCIQM
ncbi:hypothetical protein MUK42_10129 [Musa troglodytarum]|uniref:Uncharacterized protein n=1 Tax=Musa troglodytarum TaxID=320322 RepID=A0A9E7EK09_9LILI|nr:hypothetical protein MUK42_10129 [Musa troglodytarum]